MLESSPQRRLLSVQALRGFAAILVLVLHCAAVQSAGLSPDNTQEHAYLSGVWNQGYAGVDLFFVISGFIMVYVTHDRPRTPGNVGRFLYSRASRIYPLWWIYAGLMALYFWVLYGQPAAPDIVVKPEQLGAYTAKSFLLLPQAQYPVLGVGWTLIHEMYFYIIFAVLLFFNRKYIPLFLTIWAGLIIVGLIAFTPANNAVNMSALMRSPLTLEFIAGGFTGWLIVRGQFFMPKMWVIIGLVSTMAALIIGVDERASTFSQSRVWLYTLPFVASIYGLSALEHQNKLKVPAWCVRLGDWSYSLYLSHMFVLLALRRVLKITEGILPENLHYQAEGYLDNILFAVVGFAACIVVAGLSYKFIERPLLRFSRRLLRPKALAES